ncbi:glycosyl-transferase for dystroglycan-domain-containing protein [Lobosporangium transversale]|uniref:Glycosyl-transferase for dystroglycan-domain-containing protein n=1 Tax=Lobosporangium transversale TaxID=64571 RepID=A0A1Y2GGZ7_9FUNG|nr:glycosyl-transferase for dystroglycan-domain-containing protein [Lobosporangium transversale]ORZ10658.1 glycosyl-transferase for dystroglycan-domain-containing protein [Lobosporangium transversale]|eukprot:XP_021879379.1 glycosyl-transferase for dystroglycan-domain-containing protein [Lobosporangium transversale]
MRPELSPKVLVLLRYAAAVYLLGSVLFTLYSLFPQYKEPQPEPSIKPKRLTEPGQATFDVENILYSQQIMTWKSKSFLPSKVLPYYFKAVRNFNPESVTITTLITFDRYPIFSRLVTNYQGPISVSIHITDDENKDENLSKLHDMYNSNPYMKEFVDIHVIVDKFERQFNMWRNVARFFARSNYFMMLDVDFHICTDLQRHLSLDAKARGVLSSGAAVVLPAFEYVKQDDGIDSATFPKDKQALIQLVQKKKITTFHDFFPRGHNATDYEQWYKSDSVYKVTTYQHSYEPYAIMRKEGTPWCDERFIGYGANKAACLFEIYISGIDYWVLPQDFVIHQSHPYKEETRKQERKYNRRLYQNFQEETCFRYFKYFLETSQWNTSKADNLKEQCSQIRGFNQAVEQFTIS